MQIRIYILLIAVIFVSNTFARNNISIEKITVNEGLSNNCISTIIQDKDGFMWFGSNEGLNRYDGSELVTYYSNPNMPNSLWGDKINCLKVTESNQILIGTNIGLNILDSKTNVFTPIKYNNRSLGFVTDICITTEGEIFFTSKSKLFKKEGDTIKMIFDKIRIRNVIQYQKESLLLSTIHGMILINYHGELLNTITLQDINSKSLVSTIYKDSHNNIWIGTEKDGLFKYPISNNTYTPVLQNILKGKLIRTIEEDNFGKLWIGTESGVFIYNPTDQSVSHIDQSFTLDPQKLNDKAIYDIYCSKEGIIWMATYFGGVNYYKPISQGFHSLFPGENNSIRGKAISQIIEDSQKNIWIATEDGGISIWNKGSNVITYLDTNSKPVGLSYNNIHSICEGDNGVFWIGTFIDGIYKYNSRNKTIKKYYHEKNNPRSLIDNSTYAIHKDIDGDIWFGTRNGICIYNSITDDFENFMPDVFNGNFIYEILEDHDGCLWFGIMRTDELFCYNKKTQKITRYTYADQTSHMQKPGVISLCEDSKGQIWVGTRNNGLLKLNKKSGKFNYFNIKKGLPNNTVYGIVDHKDDLWISTNKGISKFNTITEKVTNYNVSHNLPYNQFNYRSYTKDSDGCIYFGSINGLAYFHPDSISTNNTEPIPYISKFKLFNKDVVPTKNGILEKQIRTVDEIELNYKDNVITFEFSAIDFLSEGKNRYAYMLDGFDKSWNNILNQKNATYTNLPHGKYILHLKAANNDGIWSKKQHLLKITIKPPFYLTPYALVLYVFVFFGLIFLYKQFLIYRNKEKAAITLERIEKNKIKEINQHKLNFFTNISHELKTPLTLIIANVDKIISTIKKEEKNYNSISTIKKHASRLHYLIDQLMEFRKVESSHAEIELKQGDIIMFMKDTFNAFIPLYEQRSITYDFKSSEERLHANFDPDKIEKIITNIISNSIKHCEEFDKISLDILISNDDVQNKNNINLVLTFKDSGFGIPSSIIDKVFEPFVKIDKEDSIISSSGIGLSYVKSLVKILNGKIDLKSKEGEGTIIKILIPVQTTINVESKYENINGNKNLSIDQNVIIDDDYFLNPKDDDDYNWKILIAEDNKNLLNFLSGHFSEKYNIITAENGKSALEKAQKQLPDLIISDVVMPQMDGIEFCSKIKEDMNTSHIPVILLTAKANPANKLEALNAGADLYLAKPFKLNEVDILVNNLISSRERIKKHFISNGKIEINDSKLNNKDQDFISKLTEIVYKHIENPDFDVNTFTKEAGVSRSLLHVKLKKIVNLNTSEFVKTIKMKKACELLDNSILTISEIAYKLGFNDPNYFSRTFKEIKGVSPTVYRNKNLKEE